MSNGNNIPWTWSLGGGVILALGVVAFRRGSGDVEQKALGEGGELVDVFVPEDASDVAPENAPPPGPPSGIPAEVESYGRELAAAEIGNRFRIEFIQFGKLHQGEWRISYIINVYDAKGAGMSSLPELWEGYWNPELIIAEGHFDSDEYDAARSYYDTNLGLLMEAAE